MKAIKLKNYKGYDTFLFPLEDNDDTWQEVLDYIESVLDDQFTGTMVGCKINMEIIEMTPVDIEMINNDD